MASIMVVVHVLGSFQVCKPGLSVVLHSVASVEFQALKCDRSLFTYLPNLVDAVTFSSPCALDHCVVSLQMPCPYTT